MVNMLKWFMSFLHLKPAEEIVMEDVVSAVEVITSITSLTPGNSVSLPPMPFTEGGANFEVETSIKRVS